MFTKESIALGLHIYLSVHVSQCLPSTPSEEKANIHVTETNKEQLPAEFHQIADTYLGLGATSLQRATSSCLPSNTQFSLHTSMCR